MKNININLTSEFHCKELYWEQNDAEFWQFNQIISFT